MTEYIGQVPIKHIREVNPISSDTHFVQEHGITRMGVSASKDWDGLDGVKITGYLETDTTLSAAQKVEMLKSLKYKRAVQCYYDAVGGFVDCEKLEFGTEKDARGIIPFSLKGQVWPVDAYLETFELYPQTPLTYDRIVVIPTEKAQVWTNTGVTISTGYRMLDYLYLHIMPHAGKREYIKNIYAADQTRFRLKIFDGAKQVFYNRHKFVNNVIVENAYLRWNITTGILSSKISDFTCTFKPTLGNGASYNISIEDISMERIRIFYFIEEKASFIDFDMMNVTVEPNGLEWTCAYTEEDTIIPLDNGGGLINHGDNVGTIINCIMPSGVGFNQTTKFALCHFPITVDDDEIYVDSGKHININKYSNSMYIDCVGGRRYLSIRSDL